MKGKFGHGYLKLLTREELNRLYHVEKLSQWQIADRFNVTQGSIFYWMRAWNIPARSHDDSLLLLGKSGRFTGKNNPRWSGGRTLASGGYVLVRAPNHPRAGCRGYVREHILVWEEANGRPLPDGWTVHHMNGIKNDNRPENLEGMPERKHRTVIAAFQRRIRELEAQLGRKHVSNCA